MNIGDLRVREQKIGVFSRFSRFCLLMLVSLFGATTAAHAVGAIAVGEYMTNDGKFAVWGIAVEAPTGAEARARATSRCNASLDEGRYTGTDSTRGPLDSSYSVTIPVVSIIAMRVQCIGTSAWDWRVVQHLGRRLFVVLV